MVWELVISSSLFISNYEYKLINSYFVPAIHSPHTLTLQPVVTSLGSHKQPSEQHAELCHNYTLT